MNKIISSAIAVSAITVSTVFGSSLVNLNVLPAQAQKNYCGPENSRTGSFLTRVGIAPWGQLFSPACQEHDECYIRVDRNIPGETKTRCEEQFKTNLYSLCKSLPLRNQGDCIGKATLMVKAVKELGLASGSVKGRYGLKVINVISRRISNRLGDDEIEICVSVRNDGNIRTEWKLALLNQKGQTIDVEPDAYQQNITEGETNKLCVNTEFSLESIRTLGGRATVVVSIDDKEGSPKKLREVYRKTISVPR
ncbi:hypothetical protein [Dolichospermum sp. LEGE 00246]|jgi:hypothetical protein|uniref:hypothetical protein n=1 Tax=Dolichospermum sp. LEGE 00246 TaxID=1828605 RepID=UPI0018828471|nr:hypothetical protein [Dolichospermum sp. LEGE 00246]MBE9258137.1 hypothetical protein [Dolichospermum sp. LEGE 00246]MDM3861990.1 hypothetical protein [Aphanizomenon gracile PMC644.10]